MLDRILYRLLTGQSGGFTVGPPDGQLPAVQVPADMYVHVPFCRSICPFCPYSKTIYDAGQAAAYGRALLSEAWDALSHIPSGVITSVYIGGGTPALMLNTLQELLEMHRHRLSPGARIATELHPEDCTPRILKPLQASGINMASLGVQSLSDRHLTSLGSRNSRASALSAVKAAAYSGFEAINVDLIMALPDQAPHEVADDISAVVSAGATQVSAYPLMLFPFTALGRSLRAPAGLAQQRQALGAADRAAREAGLERTSVWTWTRPDSSIYSSITRDSYRGLGASAASLTGGTFWVNTFDVNAYIRTVDQGRSPAALGARLLPRERALYSLFWQAYRGAVHTNRLSPSLPGLGAVLRAAAAAGLVHLGEGHATLTDRGFFLYHLIQRYYTRRYIGRLWGACRANPFPEPVIL